MANALKIEVFEGVYEPAEDSFLLRDVLLGYRGSLLEIGTGCGIVALSYAHEKKERVVGVDINERAVENAIHNAMINGIKNASFYISDVFSNVEGRFDLIAYNPPYLPQEEINDDRWNVNGSIEKFIENAKDFLTKNGRAFLLLSSVTPNYEGIIERIEESYEELRLEREKLLFFEKLFVFSFK